MLSILTRGLLPEKCFRQANPHSTQHPVSSLARRQRCQPGRTDPTQDFSDSMLLDRMLMCVLPAAACPGGASACPASAVSVT